MPLDHPLKVTYMPGEGVIELFDSENEKIDQTPHSCVRPVIEALVRHELRRVNTKFFEGRVAEMTNTVHDHVNAIIIRIIMEHDT